jgi:hypothetical protein
VSDEAPRIEHTWPAWHGSLELLLHVARVAEDGLARYSDAAPPSARAYVYVGEDVEFFESPDDFRELVSPEALRKFHLIVFEIGVPPVLVAFGVERTRRKWNLGRSWTEGGAWLVVDTADRAMTKELAERVRVALSRGCRRFDGAWRTVGTLALALLVWYAIAAYAAHEGSGVNVWTWDEWTFSILGCLVIAYWAIWQISPPIEVVPPGQSRVERTRRALYGLAIGLFAAGLTKWIYG